MTLRNAVRATVIVGLYAACFGGEAQPPVGYQKKATWQETLQACVEAAQKPGATPEQQPSVRCPDLSRNPFTFSAWIKTSGDGTLFAKAPAKGEWAPDGKALFVRGGKLAFDIGWVGTITGKKKIDDDQWHHVALVGPAAIELYVDGTLDAQGDMDSGSDATGHIGKIGYCATNFPEQSFFTGLMDEVRLHGRRLKSDEIKALGQANGGVDATGKDLLMHCSFDGNLEGRSPTGEPLKLVGAGATRVPGRIGQALQLDGKTCFQFPMPVSGSAKLAAPVPSMPAGLWSQLRRDFPDFPADFDKILFVKRLTYSANHYYTEFINSTWMPGGNLCVLDLRNGSVKELVTELGNGVFERFDLSFDAKRIVFAFKKGPQEGYRIYEVNIDGTGLKQLTFPPDNEAELVKMYRVDGNYHHGTDDMQPCYLPDGGIAFISTRCQYGILCDAPDNFTTTVIYRMDGDGKNMQKLTNSSVSEASPVMLPDGRLLYTRWEYVDKGAVSVKCLWAMRPDGSASSEIYGNDISLPPTMIYGRPIPGTSNQYVMLGTPHCPQNGVGTVIRLDMTKDIRTRDPMTYMTPYVDIQAEPGFAFREGNGPWRNDGSGKGPLFKDPYPLSRDLFLVAHKPAGPVWHDPRAYGLSLLDETGRVIRIYSDPATSCWLPYPVRPRAVPPVITSNSDRALATANQAACMVSNVYHGMKGVEQGQVKYLRVLEQIPRPWATRRRWGGDEYDQQHACITKDTHLGLKVLHGVVPVEEDGSAYFIVPADSNIFFQALDKDFMALQTERTYVNYRPGEVRGCVGCHETPTDAPTLKPGGTPLAFRRAPSQPGPQLGEKSAGRALNYATDVQPVWDKHCLQCHGAEKQEAKLDLRGTPTNLFSVSYESLVPERRKGRFDRGVLGPVVGENHPKTGNVHYLPARSMGSYSSVLMAMLSKGRVELSDPKQAERAAKLIKVHEKIQITPEELVRVATWVDTNAQFYGTYWGHKNLRYKDLPDFRPAPSLEMARSMTPP